MMNDSVENFSMLFHGGLKIRTLQWHWPKAFCAELLCSGEISLCTSWTTISFAVLSDLHCCQFSDFAAWNEVKLMDLALIKSWIRKYGGINGLYIIHYCPLVASLHLVISRPSTTTALWFILTLSLSLGTTINSPFMVTWAKLLEKRELLHVVCRNVTHTRCLASIWNKWTQEDTVHATFLFSVTTVVFVSETRTQHVQQ